jgi:hypothetical protein
VRCRRHALIVKTMRPVFTILLALFAINGFSQKSDTLKKQFDKPPRFVSFIARPDIANATKDGIYLNGYVVNISYEEAKRLNGKKIKVTGRVTIVKGVQNLPGEEARQGRAGDIKYIGSPKIEMVN